MNDLIWRRDAVSRMSDLLMLELQGQRLPTWNEVYQAMNDIPSAETERNKGEWNFIGDNMFKCTHCGVVYTTQQLNGLRNYDVDPYVPRFCPNCGADMRSDDE